jgi:CheY-like chemotaxis protein
MATILIVEDERFSVALLKEALVRAGYKVIFAKHGADGVAKAKRDLPDLVIMDMNMPEMTGWEAIRQLKADTATGKIPVIALTSAQTAGDRDEAYEAGCDAYEAKPIDLARILARVKALTGA